MAVVCNGNVMVLLRIPDSGLRSNGKAPSSEQSQQYFLFMKKASKTKHHSMDRSAVHTNHSLTHIRQSTHKKVYGIQTLSPEFILVQRLMDFQFPEFSNKFAKFSNKKRRDNALRTNTKYKFCWSTSIFEAYSNHRVFLEVISCLFIKKVKATLHIR